MVHATEIIGFHARPSKTKRTGSFRAKWRLSSLNTFDVRRNADMHIYFISRPEMRSIRHFVI